jgi:hypothetical protein
MLIASSIDIGIGCADIFQTFDTTLTTPMSAIYRSRG